MAPNASSGKPRYRGRRGNRKQNQNASNSSSNSNSNTSNSSSQNKSKEYKFYMHDSNERRSAESFGKIKDSIILKIQKTFDSPRDIVKTLRDKTQIVITEPNPAEPTGATYQERERSYQQSIRKWQEDYRWWQSKKEQCEDNLAKAYALIWENYCSKEIKRAISEMPTFESAIEHDPLELLKKLKN